MGHHQHPFKLFLLTGALGATPALPQANCPVPRVIAPALHQTVSDARPVIRWAALPGAARYRLVLTARKPEGGVLSSIDT